jgi:hypothetical protein
MQFYESWPAHSPGTFSLSCSGEEVIQMEPLKSYFTAIMRLGQEKTWLDIGYLSFPYRLFQELVRGNIELILERWWLWSFPLPCHGIHEPKQGDTPGFILFSGS